MISNMFIKGWFDGENGSNNYEYFPFFIRRVSYIYEKYLYERVVKAIKIINSKDISNAKRKKLFSSAFDARLELLFLSGYFNYWVNEDPDQKEVIRFILDYLFEVNPSDPLGVSGSYLPKEEEEIQKILSLPNVSDEISKNLIGELTLNLKALAWATTSETINMSKSMEGPYYIDSLNQFAFIRSYFNLKNPKIWPKSEEYSFDRIDVCTIYKRNGSNFGNINIDFYGNYSTSFNLNKYFRAIVLVDGKPIIEVKEIEEIINQLKTYTLSQMGDFRNISVKEQMKKLMELHCKVYKNLFTLAEMNWLPTEEMYSRIEKKELKPKTEKDEVYEFNGNYDEFTLLTMKIIDDANYDNKYNRLVEKLSNLSLKHPKGIEFYGGKAINLGLLMKKGFRVPKGIVITTEAFYRFMNQNKLFPKIKNILKDVNFDDSSTLKIVCSKIKDLIINADVDDILISEIQNKHNISFPVSVRSSATSEDLKEASFAGQLDTYLNVSNNNLVDAIKKCWASLFSSRVISYRFKKGFPIHSVSMAIIIQEMVNASVSGVAFTCNPMDKSDNSIVIDAAFGLGENIVSGSVTPDNAVISRNMEIKYEQRSKIKVLSNDQILEISNICMEIEKFYGLPQDIEWSYLDNKLYILQSRPISTKISKTVSKKLNQGTPLISGIPVSEGIIEGNVHFINSIDDLDSFKKGDILVAKTTSPEFVVIMTKAAGIITEYGGITSHAAIVSRELGIPCIVGCSEVFKKLTQNQVIKMDANTGNIYEKK